MTLSEKLSRGIDAAQQGRKTEARTLLTEVVTTDESQPEGWWWLSQVVDSLEDKIVCLENVLALEPQHPAAQQELALVQAQQARLFRPVYAPGEEQPPPQVAQPPDLSPISTAYPHHDELDNIWLCPYCLRLTRPQAETCPHCKNSLIRSRRVRSERSVWLWRGIIFQIALILVLLALWAISMTLWLKLNGIPDPIPFLPLYAGLPANQPAAAAEIVLQLYPRWVFWGFAAAVAYTLLLALLLYFRVKHANTLYLVSGGVTLLVGILIAIFFFQSWAMILLGVLAIFAGIGQLFITMNLWDDFAFRYKRLRLGLDSGVKNHTTLYLTGREYAEAGLWGLAAIHYRQAAGRQPHKAVYHLALAVAYYQTGRFEAAQKALDQAAQLDPGAPEVEELRQQIANSRFANSK
jgi:tetratricopeptide (TPR) repeat protein